MKRSKLYRSRMGLVDRTVFYSLKDAMDVLKKMPTTKFDETVEMSFRLGIDPRQSDQIVRGAMVLPQGTGKKQTVVVIAEGEFAQRAKDAGADEVGYEELLQRIKGGWLDFDVLIATPSAMKEVRTLGRVLGPRGLMPNPKAGTVSPDVAKAVTEAKAGKIEYRLDKSNIIHCPIGKASFGAAKLEENFNALMEAIVKAKPAAAKGAYLKSCTVASTMGVGIAVSTAKYGV